MNLRHAMKRVIGSTVVLAFVLVPRPARADDGDFRRWNRWGGDHRWYGAHAYPGVTRGRLGADQAAVRHGIADGELTRDEVHKLAKERRGIEREYRDYTADGHLSRGEREDLRKDERNYERDLHHQLTDDERR